MVPAKENSGVRDHVAALMLRSLSWQPAKSCTSVCWVYSPAQSFLPFFLHEKHTDFADPWLAVHQHHVVPVADQQLRRSMENLWLPPHKLLDSNWLQQYLMYIVKVSAANRLWSFPTQKKLLNVHRHRSNK